MKQIDPSVLAYTARFLDQVGLSYVFVGGSVVDLLVDLPGIADVRPTEDVDVVIEVVAHQRYSEIEARLRNLGFEHDVRTGAPICRWLLNGIVVDVMPTEGRFMGLNTRWFSDAVATAQDFTFEGLRLRVISPVAFIATKLTAFHDRGGGDFYASHDLEDAITVIDGRSGIVDEVGIASSPMRDFIAESFRVLWADSAFRDCIAGYLPADPASQMRLGGLRAKLESLSLLNRR